MLDFRIHTFLAVCRHMNFTRAAEELHITQPGVSRHIHQLEEAYGVRLFAYEGKKAVLTEAGRLLLEALGFSPLLTAGMCLGEGTGGALGALLLDQALAAYTDVVGIEDIGRKK